MLFIKNKKANPAIQYSAQDAHELCCFCALSLIQELWPYTCLRD